MVGTNCVEARAYGEAVETSHLIELEHLTAGQPDSLEGVSRLASRCLEEGKILFLPKCPFAPSVEDLAVLLRQRQSAHRWHKNIAYRPLQDRVTGFDPRHADAGPLHQALRSFSRRSLDFVSALLPMYARQWRLDYASFRPLEEQGRPLRLHARNDLIHVDSFPKRPTRGDRILRIFMNANPNADRHWITGDPLDVLAADMGDDFARQFLRPARPTLWKRAAKHLQFRKRADSRYDELMRCLHQRMKENSPFQQTCRKYETRFPPGSAWLVFTDSVPHSVVSGQYALEQTVIVPLSALLLPEKAPAALMERLGLLTEQRRAA
jgi:hypothetical protein